VKFKIDENMPVDLVADLRRAGHDADTVLDENLAGAADPIVVAASL
jgi:predicted nuclease of predicted toxin-antitoxin system